MARPYKRGNVWYARVKDGTGAWRGVALPEARTKADAERHAADLSLRYRRQRDGLEALPTPLTFTVAGLLREWLDRSLAGRPCFGRTENRVQKHLESSELGLLPVARLTPERIEAFLQARTAARASPAMVNHCRRSEPRGAGEAAPGSRARPGLPRAR